MTPLVVMAVVRGPAGFVSCSAPATVSRRVGFPYRGRTSFLEEGLARRHLTVVTIADVRMSHAPTTHSALPKSGLSPEQAQPLAREAFAALQRADPETWEHYEHIPSEALRLIARRMLRFGARVESAGMGWHVLRLADRVVGIPVAITRDAQEAIARS